MGHAALTEGKARVRAAFAPTAAEEAQLLPYPKVGSSAPSGPQPAASDLTLLCSGLAQAVAAQAGKIRAL